MNDSDNTAKNSDDDDDSKIVPFSGAKVPNAIVEPSRQEVEEVLEKHGLRGRHRVSWSGPLPPQVIEKISPEVANEMALSLCRRQEKQEEFMAKVLMSQRNSERESRLYKLLSGILIAVAFMVVFSICAFLNKDQLLHDLIEKGILIFGGAGAAYGISRAKGKESQPVVEFDED